MTKSDLKTGMRVKLRNGDVYVVLRSVKSVLRNYEFILCKFENGFMFDTDYNDDLKICINSDKGIKKPHYYKSSLDVMEVYAAPEFGYMLDRTYPVDCIWEREEEPIEITIEEIAKIKGVSPDRIRIKE